LAVAAVPTADAAASGPRLSRVERGIVRGIDYQRRRTGERHVRTTRALERAAAAHSGEMLAGNYFAHTSINGGSFAARVHRFTRARDVGETLAWVTSCRGGAAHTIMSMWMSSAEHRTILLTRGYRRVGVAARAGWLGSAHVCVVTADFSH
jgi:uncharacterized protein YkwD